MILEKLIVENFRQFRGRQEIVFSDLRERNVTLVHAENGFGKTALLNPPESIPCRWRLASWPRGSKIFRLLLQLR